MIDFIDIIHYRYLYFFPFYFPFLFFVFVFVFCFSFSSFFPSLNFLQKSRDETHYVQSRGHVEWWKGHWQNKTKWWHLVFPHCYSAWKCMGKKKQCVLVKRAERSIEKRQASCVSACADLVLSFLPFKAPSSIWNKMNKFRMEKQAV